MIIPSNLDEMFPAVCNTEDGEIWANVRHACSLDLPWLQVSDVCEGVAVIVGGGPSLRSTLPIVRAQKAAGAKLFAINGTMRFLSEQGIEADYFVMLDARAGNLRFIDHRPNVEYLIASQCAPSAFELLKGENVTLWHPNYPGVQEIIGERLCALIGGGTTVGLQAMSIAYAKGFRQIHLHGFDSSYAEGDGHAYKQDLNDADEAEEYRVGRQKFMAAPWMLRQAVEFQGAVAQLANDGTEVHVHGSGLLPAIAHEIARQAA